MAVWLSVQGTLMMRHMSPNSIHSSRPREARSIARVTRIHKKQAMEHKL